MSKSRYPQLNNRDWLYHKYWIEGLNSYEIADIVGCSEGTVLNALKRHNIKRRTYSEALKGERNGNYGKHRSEETKRKISEGHKGEKCYWYGKHFSEEHKRKQSEALKGEKSPCYGKRPPEETIKKMKETHRKEEIREKHRKARKKQKFPASRTKIECIYWDISKKNNIPSEYTGDSKIWIGRVNPDFIIRDKRVAIFINGDYWHSALLRPNLGYTQRPENQIKECKRHKWIPVIIWENDLLREDAEQRVLFILKEYKIMPLSSRVSH